MLQPGHNRGQVPTARPAVPPKRKEPFWLRYGAAPHVVDVGLVETIGEELRTQHTSQIDVRLRARAIHDLGIERCSHDGSSHVLRHFERGERDVRTDRGDQIGLRGQTTQARDRRADDSLHGAAPARVRGGDRAAPAIGKQNRDAVRAAHPAREPWRAAEQSVPLDVNELRLDFVTVQGVRDAAVHLRQEMDASGSDAELHGGSLQITSNIELRVAGGDRKAQASVRAFRHSSAPREESMSEACFTQQVTFQELSAITHG